jgi:prepilin-type N-terminal cleavage/methylation domain-containing protein
MRISLAGATNRLGQRPAPRERGVTLLELLIVMTLMALLAGLSYPSIASGLDSLRLRSASNAIVAFLNTALERADRRQQAVEIWISPRENSMTARSADLGFVRRLDIPEPIRIVSVMPSAMVNADEPRRFFLYPGGSVPQIAVEIATKEGRKRLVSVDPITGVSRSELQSK